MLQNWKAHIFRPAYYPPLHHGAHSLLPSISFAPTDFTHYYTSRPTPPQAHILLNAFTAAFRINETVSVPKKCAVWLLDRYGSLPTWACIVTLFPIFCCCKSCNAHYAQGIFLVVTQHSQNFCLKYGIEDAGMKKLAFLISFSVRKWQ